MQFNIPCIKLLINMGYKVDVACNFNLEYNTLLTEEKIDNFKKELDKLGCKYYQVDFHRSPAHIGMNLKAYKQVSSLLKKKNYKFVHCHSPIGGIIGRLACKKNNTKTIYTAHGFHFYDGAPTKNWLLYYPAEWICSWYTDTLITINKEDFDFAKRNLHARKVEYVPGVGVDLNKFCTGNTDIQTKRKEISIPDNMIWILNVGELSTRKNQEMLIRSVKNFPDVYLTIAGKGELEAEYIKLIRELGLEKQVKLLGFRTDISELCEACDIFALPSIQEGLSVALMEAMACGKPIVCSRIRGNEDLIDVKGGELFDPKDYDEIVKAIENIKERDFRELGNYNLEKVQSFGLSSVMSYMKTIYEHY